MKIPNVFFKLWRKDQCEPDMPKLGINWFTRRGSRFSPWTGGGIDFIFFGKRFDITWADDGQAYANEFGRYEEKDYDFSLIPVKPNTKHNKTSIKYK